MLRKRIEPPEWNEESQRLRSGRSLVLPLALASIGVSLGAFAVALALIPHDPPVASAKKFEAELVGSITILPRADEGPATLRETIVVKSDELARETEPAEAQPLTGQLAELDATTADGSKAQTTLAPAKDREPPKSADPDFRKGLAEDSIDAAALDGPMRTARRTEQRSMSSRATIKSASRDKLKKVSNDVRLRSRPDNAAKSVAVIPGGKRVKVIRCKLWCEVLYAGKRGFVYKTFLER